MARIRPSASATSVVLAALAALSALTTSCTARAAPKPASTRMPPAATTIATAGVGKRRDEIKDLVLKDGASEVSLALKPLAGTTGATVTVTSGPNTRGGTALPGGGQPPTGRRDGPGYAHDVKPFLDVHCAECHHSGKTLDLTQFPFGTGDQTIIVARILALVDGVAATMPPAPRDKLNAADVTTLKAWRDAGLMP